MNERNHSDINYAMNFVLRPMLAAFVQKNLARHFGADNWWRRGVLDVLYDDQKRFLPPAGTYDDLTDALDVSLCLLLIDIHWRDVFSARLPRNYLNYVKELKLRRRGDDSGTGHDGTNRRNFRRRGGSTVAGDVERTTSARQTRCRAGAGKFFAAAAWKLETVA